MEEEALEREAIEAAYIEEIRELRAALRLLRNDMQDATNCVRKQIDRARLAEALNRARDDAIYECEGLASHMSHEQWQAFCDKMLLPLTRDDAAEQAEEKAQEEELARLAPWAHAYKEAVPSTVPALCGAMRARVRAHEAFDPTSDWNHGMDMSIAVLHMRRAADSLSSLCAP